MWRFLSGLCLSAGLAGSALAAGDPALSDPKVAAVLAGLDRAFAAEQTSRAFPGLAAAIVHDQTLLMAHGYGVADQTTGAAVTADTRFHVASISKLFTALAIVQLRDAGKLMLDDKVADRLPGFHLAGDPHPAITIRELLTQLGGLAREPLSASWQARSLPDSARLMADLDREEAAIPRESGWKYSNLGYAILGQVVAHVSGESFPDYVRRHIAEPLGMKATEVEPKIAARDLARGYGAKGPDGVREVRPDLDLSGTAGAAGVVTSVADLARFAEFLLADGDNPVLSAASRCEMLRVQAILPDWSGGQGLGFEIRHTGNQTRIGHAGRAGGFAGRFDIDPATKIGAVVLINADENGPGRLVEQALTQLAGPVTAAVEAAKPKPVADPAWQKYVGRYVNEGHESEIVLAEGRLAWQDPGDPAHSRIWLDPAGPDAFRYTAGALVGEKLHFLVDEAGHVTGMRAAGTTDLRK